jgi:hypothetical protein
MYSDMFIITSVINTGSNPWSYTSQRSCFTKEERLQQTLQTIDSIRQFHGTSCILLVECSDLEESITNTLRNKVDYFLQTFHDVTVRQACLESIKKGYGEVKQLDKACEFIVKNGIAFNRLFKISGRYYLNSSFHKNQYSLTEFTFKMIIQGVGSTVLYAVPYDLFNIYRQNIQNCILFYEVNYPTGLETLLPVMCVPRYDISNLGVSGRVAVVNDKGESDSYTA